MMPTEKDVQRAIVEAHTSSLDHLHKELMKSWRFRYHYYRMRPKYWLYIKVVEYKNWLEKRL